MRHYEVVFLIHPNWYGFVNSIIVNYKNIVENNHGIIYRSENWGCRRLAYSIKNVQSAYYVLLNIECSVILMSSLIKSFRFNEAILRSLVIRKNVFVKNQSPILSVIKESSV